MVSTPQTFLFKGRRKDFTQREDLIVFRRLSADDGGNMKFRHHLAADAAGHRVIFQTSDDGYGFKIPFPIADGAADGISFCTESGRIRNVFHIAAFIDGTVGREDCGPHGIMGIGRIAVGPGVKGSFEKIFYFHLIHELLPLPVFLPW